MKLRFGSLTSEHLGHGGHGRVHGGGHGGHGGRGGESTSRIHAVGGGGGRIVSNWWSGYPYPVFIGDITVPQWTGKHLIRKGANSGFLETNIVYESSIKQPYLILPEGASPQGYRSDRLLVYVDNNDIVTGVVVG